MKHQKRRRKDPKVQRRKVDKLKITYPTANKPGRTAVNYQLNSRRDNCGFVGLSLNIFTRRPWKATETKN